MKNGLPASLAGLLDGAAADGRTIAIWWRDDDAVADTAALDRLLGLAAEHAAPLAIAAIPGRIEASLHRKIAREPLASILIHGLDHTNHAPAGEKAAEFGDHRPQAEMAADVARARSVIRAAFGARSLDVFVPPWNRISAFLTSRLPELGFRGLSAFGPDLPKGAVPGLAILNTHLDPVDWRGSRSLAAPNRLSAALQAALAGDRAFGAGPIGLLSHHLAFDNALWEFWEHLLADLAQHPAVRLTGLAAILAQTAPSSTCTSQVALGYGDRQGERIA